MKRNLFLASMIFILSVTVSNAQSWQWGRNGGGSVSTGTGDNSLLDMKADKLGNMYFLSVISKNTARFMGDTFIVHDDDDLLLYKLDCNGNQLWHKQLGVDNGNDDLVYHPSLQLDNDDNVYVVGFNSITSVSPYYVSTDTIVTLPSGGGYLFSYIVKFDKHGNYKYFKSNSSNRATNLISYIKAVMGNDNHLYILTALRGNVLGRIDTTLEQYYILKYDTNAVLQSLHQISDSGAVYNWSMTCDKKNIYIGGYTDNIGASSKITIYTAHQVSASKTFICKFDTSGVFKWLKLNDDTHTAITELKYNKNNGVIYACGGGGGYYTVGDTGTRYGSFRLLNPVTSVGFNRDDSPLMIAFDTSGNVVGGNIVGMRYVSSAFGIDVSNLNHILIGGRAVGHTSIGTDTFNTNGQDGFYAELNSDLEFIGGATLNGNGFYDQVSKVSYDERGNIYVGGYMAGDLYLPGDTLRKIPGGNSNLFIAKYGVPSCLCAYAVSNFSDVYASSLTYSYTSSAVNADTIWWDFGDGNTQSGGTTATHTYATAGNYTVCQHVENVCSIDEFCKNISVVTSIDEVKETYSVIIYPNPANTSLHIHLQGGEIPNQSQYALFDVSGKQVLSGKMTGKDTSIMISNTIIDGIYFLQINDVEGKMMVSKRVEVVR